MPGSTNNSHGKSCQERSHDEPNVEVPLQDTKALKRWRLSVSNNVK